MAFTSEQVAGRMGLSIDQINDSTIDTFNSFLDKYTEKVLNLNFIDSKWKTFTFRNKVKNMSNVNEPLIKKFLSHIEDQCKKLHINMIINDEIKEEVNDGIPQEMKQGLKTETVGDNEALQQIKKRKLNNSNNNSIANENNSFNTFSDDSLVNDSVNETVYKTPESSKIINNSVMASNSKTKLQFTDAFNKDEYNLNSETEEHNKSIKKLFLSCKLTDNLDNKENFKILSSFDNSFKIMRDSTTKIAKNLDDDLEISKNDFNFAISDPTIQSQSSIFTKGRIVVDGIDELDPVFETKNLALETSQNVGIGKRIKIDVSNLPKGTDLFLGQVIVCKGKNITGKEFIIEELIKENIENNNKNDDEIKCYGDSTIVSVNGPFCNEKNMNYSIFEKFIKETINNDIKPDFLIINGPIIDISNHCLMTGIIPPFEQNGNFLQIDTIDDIFVKIVFPILAEIDPSINVFVVPHASESISKYTTYPQPSYSQKLVKLLKTVSIPKNLHFVSNPSILNLNGFNFGINNIDIFKNLKNLSLDNLFLNRFKTITRLMIENNSFYPCYPTIPALNDKTISTKLSKELFENEEEEEEGEEKEKEEQKNYEDLIVTRNRMNKNIVINEVNETCNIPNDININFMLHNSSYVPHLEQIENGCVSINSNAFHQGNKLGFYTVIKTSKKEDDSCDLTVDIKKV